MNEIDLRRVDLNLLVAFEALMAERSVTAAARRLGRTQSAVSHALARLRAQLADPLLVKSRGGMAASPFAELLAAEIGPILARVRRALQPPEEFDPATAERAFRLAIPDVNDALFPILAERVLREAPRAALEWLARGDTALLAVAEGQIDLALSPLTPAMPEGLDYAPVRPFRWGCFMRRDHPAARKWGKAAWLAWPHVAVRVSANVPNPVDAAAPAAAKQRRIAVRVPHFSAVAPLLARTDLIATLPLLVMTDALDRFGLRAVEPPVRIEPMKHCLVWSRRLGNDPAIRWLRARVAGAFEAIAAEADRILRP